MESLVLPLIKLLDKAQKEVTADELDLPLFSPPFPFFEIAKKEVVSQEFIEKMAWCESLANPANAGTKVGAALHAILVVFLVQLEAYFWANPPAWEFLPERYRYEDDPFAFLRKSPSEGEPSGGDRTQAPKQDSTKPAPSQSTKSPSKRKWRLALRPLSRTRELHNVFDGSRRDGKPADRVSRPNKFAVVRVDHW
jgi:hypothetical protein